MLTSKAVETFSKAALEAMAMARPERVTRWAGTSVPSRPVAVGNAG